MDLTFITLALLLLCLGLLLRSRIFPPKAQEPATHTPPRKAKEKEEEVPVATESAVVKQDAETTLRQRGAKLQQLQQEEVQEEVQEDAQEEEHEIPTKDVVSELVSEFHELEADRPAMSEDTVASDAHVVAKTKEEIPQKEQQQEKVVEGEQKEEEEEVEKMVAEGGSVALDASDILENEEEEQDEEEEDDDEEDDDEEEEEQDLTEVKYSEASSSTNLIAACASIQGSRPHNEDRFVVNTSELASASVFAVFDGHDGPAASAYCAKNFLKFIKSSNAFPRRPKTLLTRVFLKLDRLFLDKGEEGGSTAVVALLLKRGKKLYVANAGDSRCVVSVGGKAVALSTDHKPDLPQEKERIEARNHEVKVSMEINQGKRTKVARVDGKLAVSRAIGDTDFKDDPSAEPKEQAVTADPEITEVDITPEHEFLVLACDGLYDVMTNQDVVDYVAARIKSVGKHEQLADLAKDLAHHAVTTLGSTDNVTAIIVKF